MAKEDLFSVEHGILIINKEYLRGIPEFKKILERIHKIEGDHDGRKKFRNYQILYYVYIRTSMYSYPNRGGMSNKEVETIAIKESKLESNYKPDQEVLDAMAKYKELELITTPTLNAINSIIKTLKLSSDICNSVNEDIESVLEIQKKNREKQSTTGEPVNIAESVVNTENLIKSLNQVLTIANKIPDTMSKMEELNEKLLREEMGDNIGRGGKKLGNRAEPKS